LGAGSLATDFTDRAALARGGRSLFRGSGGRFATLLLVCLRVAKLLLLLPLVLAPDNEFFPMANDEEDGTLLQIVLNLVEVAEVALHSHDAHLVNESLAHGVASPSGLNSNSSRHSRMSILFRHEAILAEHGPRALDFDGSEHADPRDQPVPSEALLLAPPGLDSDGCLRLSDREHFAAHEQLHACRVETVQDVFALTLRERDAELVLVDAIDVEFSFHVGNLRLQLE